MAYKALFVKAIIDTHEKLNCERTFFIDVDYDSDDSASNIQQKIKESIAEYMCGYVNDVQQITSVTVL